MYACVCVLSYTTLSEIRMLSPYVCACVCCVERLSACVCLCVVVDHVIGNHDVVTLCVRVCVCCVCVSVCVCVCVVVHHVIGD